MIKIEKLNKYYNKGKGNEIHVINDVTLELPNTGLISFLGASGSGKTTLLNVIGGLDKAKGSISYDGLKLEKYNMHKVDKFRSREIGYVFQNYNLLLEETVYNNLAIALDMIGIYDLEEQAKRIEYTLKAVGMYKFRKKRAFALSGGQQQRVSIARALVKNCKIIIADEPTGNLDSENTIEVMNILKKISKSSLVLLVTHNEDIAKFYSDQVIRISDGLIEDIYINDGNHSLNTEQSNNIYLKDMVLNQNETDLVSIQYYSTNQPTPLELRIIEKNGTFYISGNEKLKLLEDTNIKVYDRHYEALKQTELTEFNYDTSWFCDTKKKDNWLKRLGKSLLESFNKMRFSKKRTRYLYFSFFIIGILLGICVIGFSNYYIADDSHLAIDKNFQTLTTDRYSGFMERQDMVQKLLNHDLVEGLTTPKTFNGSFKKIFNYSEKIEYNINVDVIGYRSCEHLNLLIGDSPKKNEIVITKPVAEEIVHYYPQYFSSYEDLLGMDIQDRNNRVSLKICAIAENPYPLGYMYDETFLELFFSYEYALDSLKQRDYKIEKQYETYEITYGRDLVEDDRGTNHILLEGGKKEQVGKTIQFGQSSYEVVGCYQFKEYGEEKTYISFQQETIYSDPYGVFYTYTDRNDFTIVEGRKPQALNECLVSIYSEYKKGDTIVFANSGFEVEYRIVGKYNSNSNMLSQGALFSREMVILNSDGFYWFKVDDIEEANELLKENEFSIIPLYDYFYNDMEAEHWENLLVFGILSLVLIVTISIFIYFIMRSRMISDIYPIGVYRSIGASRLRILGRFISDIFVTVTLTSLIGYAITIFISDTVAASINNALSMNALKSSYLFSFLGVLLLYALNFLFGLLPIFMLMRKTPAEIISKYDI